MPLVKPSADLAYRCSGTPPRIRRLRRAQIVSVPGSPSPVASTKTRSLKALKNAENRAEKAIVAYASARIHAWPQQRFRVYRAIAKGQLCGAASKPIGNMLPWVLWIDPAASACPALPMTLSMRSLYAAGVCLRTRSIRDRGPMSWQSDFLLYRSFTFQLIVPVSRSARTAARGSSIGCHRR